MLPSSQKPYANVVLARQQQWRGRVGMMLVASLSVLAGMTDAIGFMASGDFVSFMSGNTTRLAVAISEGDLGLTGRLLLLVATFVVGNANRLSASILDPGSTIASRIANEFNEALGLQLNALIALGCILFFVTFVVLVIARLLVARVKRY